MVNGGFAIIISYLVFIGFFILSPYKRVGNKLPVYNYKFNVANS